MGFRQFRAAQLRDQKSNSGGKLYPPFEADNFKLDINETANVRILDPGNDGPYIRKIVWIGFPRTSTADWPGFNGKCVYNHYWSIADKGSKDKDNLYPSKKYVVEVIDFRYFHQEVYTDKDRERLRYVRCGVEGPKENKRRCKHCASDDPEISRRIFGGHKVWELGKTHFSQLNAVDQQLAQVCVSDDDRIYGKEVFTIGFFCPDCGEEVLSERDLQTMAPDAIEQTAYSPFKCEKCGFEGLPKELSVAMTDDDEEIEAERGSLFLKNLEITRAGEKFIDNRGNEKSRSSLNVDKAAPFQPVEELLAEHGFSDDAIAEMLEPWDFSQRFLPERISPEKYSSEGEYTQAVWDAQAKAIDRDNPFKGMDNSGPRSVPFRSNSGFRR